MSRPAARTAAASGRAHEREPQADRDRQPHAARPRRSRYPIPRTVSIGESPFARELAAQVADVDVDQVGAGVEGVAPHAVQDLLARQHLAGMPHQVGEQGELARRERHADAVDLGLAREQVERYRPHLDRGGAPGLVVGPACVGADARSELGERERLHEIVGRAQVEAAHPVGDLAAGRQHDHGQGRVHRPDRGEHVEPVDAGEHHVEDDDVGPPVAHAVEAVLAAGGGVHGVALRGQSALKERQDQRLVLDHEDLHWFPVWREKVSVFSGDGAGM